MKKRSSIDIDRVSEGGQGNPLAPRKHEDEVLHVVWVLDANHITHNWQKDPRGALAHLALIVLVRWLVVFVCVGVCFGFLKASMSQPAANNNNRHT